jgi:glycopeptide antibiotics resistance protein
MTYFSFAFTTSLIFLGWFVFRLSANLKDRNFSLKREALQLLFLVNLAVISRMVFHPMATVDGAVQPLIFEAATAWPFRVNLIPFVNLLDYESKRDLLLNIIGNCAMFIPTGILTPVLYRHLDSFKKTVLTGFLISLAIEIIQLPFAVRASDIDDLILNTLGFFLGYLIYLGYKKKKARR